MRNFIRSFILIAYLFSITNIVFALPFGFGSKTDTQTDYVTLKKQTTNPSSPAIDSLRFFINNDNEATLLDSEGNSVAFGSGGGLGSGDTVFIETFETAKLVNVIRGNDVSDLNGAGTLAGTVEIDSSSCPMFGKKCLKYTQASGSLNDYVCNPSQVVDQGFINDKPRKLIYRFKYDGDPSDIRIRMYLPGIGEVDSTNVYTLNSEGEVSIVYNSLNSQYIRVCAQVVTANAGKILYVDNTELSAKVVDVGEIFNASQWQSFPMEIRGSISNPVKATSPAVDQAFWRRVGDSMEIHYTYQHDNSTGASAGSGYYKFMLPSGYTIDTSRMGTVVLYNTVGNSLCFATGSSVLTGSAVYRGGVDHIALLVGDETTGGTEVSSGFIPLTTAAIRYSFKAVVPIQGWKAYKDAVVSEDASNLSTKVYGESFNGDATVTALTTKIKFTQVEDTKDEWDGENFIPKESGLYLIKPTISLSSTVTGRIMLYQDNTQIGPISSTVSSSLPSGSLPVFLTAGLPYNFRYSTNATLVAASEHQLRISRESRRNINFGGNNGDYYPAEHKTGQKWIDGRDVYRQVIVVPNDITTSDPFVSIATGLELINKIKMTGIYYIYRISDVSPSSGYAQVFYNPSTGVVTGAASGYTINAGQSFIIEYVKP